MLEISPSEGKLLAILLELSEMTADSAGLGQPACGAAVPADWQN
jgi:hypothetical protein